MAQQMTSEALLEYVKTLKRSSGGSGGVTDYNDLTGKPTLNGQTIQGNMVVEADKNFVYIQATPGNTWTVTHGLNKYPTITVVDSAGSEVIGEYEYTDLNNVVLTFSGAFAGKAFFN